MSLFLKKIALFSLIIVFLLAIGEIIVRNQPNSYSYKHKWVKDNGSNINTLILGSSHAYYGINANLLGDSVFNLANISQMPDYDFELLKYYDSDLKNLKRVIIPISYFTFKDRVFEESDEWNLAINYKIHMKLPIHSDFSIYNFEISDFNTYSQKLKNIILPKVSNVCDSLGDGLNFDLSTRSDNWESYGKRRAQELTGIEKNRADEVSVILADLIEYCRAKNIECIFITTPTWHTFRENMDSTQYADMRRRTVELCDKYGVRYFDYFDDARFNDEDFHDVDHLSDIGAEKLTRIFVSDAGLTKK